MDYRSVVDKSREDEARKFTFRVSIFSFIQGIFLFIRLCFLTRPHFIYVNSQKEVINFVINIWGVYNETLTN